MILLRRISMKIIFEQIYRKFLNQFFDFNPKYTNLSTIFSLFRYNRRKLNQTSGLRLKNTKSAEQTKSNDSEAIDKQIQKRLWKPILIISCTITVTRIESIASACFQLYVLDKRDSANELQLCMHYDSKIERKQLVSFGIRNCCFQLAKRVKVIFSLQCVTPTIPKQIEIVCRRQFRSKI